MYKKVLKGRTGTSSVRRESVALGRQQLAPLSAKQGRERERERERGRERVRHTNAAQT